MSPRRGSRRNSRCVFCCAFGAQFVVAQHLQIHEAVAQPGEGRPQQQRQQQQSLILQLFGHLKTPAARGDRFLIRQRHERR